LPGCGSPVTPPQLDYQSGDNLDLSTSQSTSDTGGALEFVIVIAALLVLDFVQGEIQSGS
jgi:hypothetical protein